jgi:N-acetylglucosaminyl-diphospho-decaprenol L-rhamnosyltransferase
MPELSALSVVIVTYRSSSVIAPCLQSIRRFNDIGDHLQVTVVDNSPTSDPTYGLVCDEFPWVQAVRNPKKGGYGQGNNVGARLSRGKYLLFLNPDTELVEPLFEFTISAFESDTRLAVFGVQLLTADHRRSPSFFLRDQRVTKYPHGIPRLISLMGHFNATTMTCSGAAMFIRRDVFQRIGCFDEGLFMGYEESDIWNRIDELSEGWYGRFFRQKRFVHLGGSSQGIRTPELFALPHVEHETVRHFYNKYGLDFRSFLRYERQQAQLRVWYWRLRGRPNLCREARLRVVELDQMLQLEK